MEKLKEFAKQFIRDGVLATNISKTEDGYRILFLENDSPHCVTRVFCAYTSGADNKVGFIEHSYGAFTRANASEVMALVSLIGATVDINDSHIGDEYPIKEKE